MIVFFSTSTSTQLDEMIKGAMQLLEQELTDAQVEGSQKQGIMDSIKDYLEVEADLMAGEESQDRVQPQPPRMRARPDHWGMIRSRVGTTHFT